MARANIKQQPQQLDLFQVQAEYPKEIVHNSSQEINLNDLDVSKNVLICNVKKDNVHHFLDGTAKIYYTGKKFPSTVALNKLYYFMPYIKGKGVSDLYLITEARVGTKAEVRSDSDDERPRLVFELEYLESLPRNQWVRLDKDSDFAFKDTLLGRIFKDIK